MPYYVYILKCNDGSKYAGFTVNLRKRLKEHQAGIRSEVKNKRPIKLIFYCCFSHKHTAALFEQYLKTHSGREFRDKHLLSNQQAKQGACAA